MNQNGDRVRIAAMADLHVQETEPHSYHDLFASIADNAHVLLLCGDLTNTGSAKEAEVLAEDLKSLRIPVIGVLGNHDFEKGQSEEVRKILRAANVIFLDDQGYKLKNVGFAGVKGFCGGFNKHMLTPFGEEEIKRFVDEAIQSALRLETQLQSLNTEHKVVLLHYAPVPETVFGEPPEVYPFLGCSRLAETIDRFEVSAVFHGHAHYGSLEGKTAKGAAVYNCCVELLKARQAPRPYVLLEI